MSRPLRRRPAAALLLSAVFAAAAPALAVPPAPRFIAPPRPLIAPRTSRAAPLIVHGAAASLRFAPRAAQFAPIRTLPLIVRPAQLAAPLAPPAPLRFLPLVLPRLGLAALFAPLGPWDCGAHHAPVLLAALPSDPFGTMTCLDRSGSTGASRDTTSLAPGRNKNALYGRAYTPSPDEIDEP